MSTFTERWRQLSWDDIALRINSKTAADVERALHARMDIMSYVVNCVWVACDWVAKCHSGMACWHDETAGIF